MGCWNKPTNKKAREAHMLQTGYKPIKSKVLIIEEGLAQLDTALGRSAKALVGELQMRDVVVIQAVSYQDGMASIVSDTSIHAAPLSWELEGSAPSGVPQPMRSCPIRSAFPCSCPVRTLAARTVPKSTI